MKAQETHCLKAEGEPVKLVHNFTTEVIEINVKGEDVRIRPNFKSIEGECIELVPENITLDIHEGVTTTNCIKIEEESIPLKSHSNLSHHCLHISGENVEVPLI